MIEKFIRDKSWNVVEKLNLPGRKGQYFPVEDIPLSDAARRYLKAAFPGGIYRHQKEAMKSFSEGNNVCITTGTASGKSLPFYVAAMEKLVSDPRARVIVVVTVFPTHIATDWQLRYASIAGGKCRHGSLKI